ncbi:hypothetical protein CC86DRAFT_468195 [Ophiobolus disseminans]|uniref:Uncharacterized protein n=1 Tax=Ophiobolus disseminans TaxID=1469910 RepID=A0A6A6ZWI3_9PLEO|nr:hypothetical protein CC86DRAFT_468195 [Ophiobolus disseminans]
MARADLSIEQMNTHFPRFTLAELQIILLESQIRLQHTRQPVASHGGFSAGMPMKTPLNTLSSQPRRPVAEQHTLASSSSQPRRPPAQQHIQASSPSQPRRPAAQQHAQVPFEDFLDMYEEGKQIRRDRGTPDGNAPDWTKKRNT